MYEIVKEIMGFNPAKNWREFLEKIATLILGVSLEDTHKFPSMKITIVHNSTSEEHAWLDTRKVDKIVIKKDEADKRSVQIIFPPASRQPENDVEVWYVTDKGTREEEAGGFTLKLVREKLASQEFTASITHWLKEQKKPNF